MPSRPRESAAPPSRQLPELLSDNNARLAAARRLTRRAARRETGRFLAEGAPAVREALARPGVVQEVFATSAALERHAPLLAGAPVSTVSERTAAALSETVHPQGLVAVCRRVDVPPETIWTRPPRLAVLLVAPNDPGNLGTILRTADAAGAGAVLVADGVDVYNGKAVRASAGSLFHLHVSVDADPVAAIDAARASGSQVLAADAGGAVSLDDAGLAAPTLWLFGNEAHGLPAELRAAADASVRVPIHGSAESLNLAAAAAVCLYASAGAQRSSPGSPKRG